MFFIRVIRTEYTLSIKLQMPSHSTIVLCNKVFKLEIPTERRINLLNCF